MSGVGSQSSLCFQCHIFSLESSHRSLKGLCHLHPGVDVSREGSLELHPKVGRGMLRWGQRCPPQTVRLKLSSVRAADSTTEASPKRSSVWPWHPPVKHLSPPRPRREEEDDLVGPSMRGAPVLEHNFVPVGRADEDRCELAFIENKLLSDICTWGIGGPAKYFIRVRTEDDMARAISHCHSNRIQWFVVGRGSNCLFDDRGYDGCIILNQISFLEKQGNGVYRVGSGYLFNTLGVECSKDGFSGLEFAGGVPGTVGGAVFMNAGADGQETSSCLQSVEIVTTSGERQILRKERGELPYSYRMSPFQKMEGLAAVVAATFQLEKDPLARERQVKFMNRRRQTQPVTERTAGCVFRNPGDGCNSAGALIDKLGLKGTSVGGASVSEKHANFFINRGNSNAADMLALISTIKERIRAEHNVELEEEIRHVPFR
eukprot:TRINITY_DN420_c0_g2_i1.p1 TRINITY_DN420_c0_g2~~TRINITY_DN420_c0_g2_i1.p1  ORF type:complete len:431 (-),score=51.81 TRINITY_DN420_c0_g2_i1:141-1433(-)